MEEELYQLLLSLKLGDGCFIYQNKGEPKNYYFSTNCIKKDYVDYKLSVIKKNNIKTVEYVSYSGYKEQNSLYAFRTHNDERISVVGRMTVLNAIKELNKLGLILLFLDDGSIHKKKGTIHIYCNSFSDTEVDALVEKIFELYGEKRCTKLMDNKKDGRMYPYLYVPKVVATKFKEDIEKFLIENNITSLFYKANLPSQTIENKE